MTSGNAVKLMTCLNPSIYFQKLVKQWVVTVIVTLNNTLRINATGKNMQLGTRKEFSVVPNK